MYIYRGSVEERGRGKGGIGVQKYVLCCLACCGGYGEIYWAGTKKSGNKRGNF